MQEQRFHRSFINSSNPRNGRSFVPEEKAAGEGLSALTSVPKQFPIDEVHRSKKLHLLNPWYPGFGKSGETNKANRTSPIELISDAAPWKEIWSF